MIRNSQLKLKESFIVIGLYFISYVLFSNLISLAIILIWGVDAIWATRIVQFFIDVTILILICYFCKRILKNDSKELMYTEFYVNILKYYAIFWFINIVINLPMAFITNGGTSINQQTVEDMLQNQTIYMLFTVIIFAPLVEELVFRGAIYGAMRKKFGIFSSIIVSSLTFTLMHFVTSIALGNISDLIYIAVYLAPSIALCIAYEKTNNIYIPISIHLINNLIGVAVTFIYL